ncbi:hypothetical protein D9619_013291 [Psilocybe cf. subviscida]|uniref:DUF3533 domain-containing protein n=1 Tax=Psilocybe cf. subviscida TaxID=2480587 RepID=A0A8H5BRY2_9AGAR|nr:hypothetical protein D9619_013291 [Psilocybe cf. subviscida]
MHSRPSSRSSSTVSNHSTVHDERAPKASRTKSTTPPSAPAPTANATPRQRTARVFDHTPAAALARQIYLKVVGGGIFMVVLLIFTVLSIFWGSTWKIPAHKLPGWVVDFDNGDIGRTVTHALTSSASNSKIAWTVLPASAFPGGAAQVAGMVLEEKTWVAVVVNSGASARLAASLASPNASYDGADAVTVYAVEARNENGFRNIIRPSIQAALDALASSFARSTAQRIANGSNVAELLSASPQTVTAPLRYRIDNLAPFDVPVATAVTFVGLIYQLILSFFVVMLSDAARTASSFSSTLTTRSLVLLRLGTSFVGYFVVSLFYSLLSVAFQLDVSKKFGHSGFLVFWMLNYCSMLAGGLALEAMLTLLTSKFIAFFMLVWLITNLSVCVFPIEVMPHIFRYGYGAPFYNVSQAMRAVVFGTKNVVGLSFGILIVWIAISCITMPVFQWFVHQREAAASTSAQSTEAAAPQQTESEKRASHESDGEADHGETVLGSSGRVSSTV